ncbi:MAG: ScbA/BarX family gamma-butyrolactone biosynthesis protein [Natronosporangium sp.]
MPRHLVHRAAIAEVFVTDSRVIGEHAYQVAAQLPRGHAIGEDAYRYDFLLLVETVRQAGVLIAHSYLDVSVQTPFVFRALKLQIRDLGRLVIGSSPGKAVIHTTVEPVHTPAGRLRGLAFKGGVEIDGWPALDGEGHLLFVTASSYAALRRRGREQKLSTQLPVSLSFTPALPATVGRENARNVVITEPTLSGERRLQSTLIVDRGHPYLFDHPLDHVPGNLSVEACRQAAVAAVSRVYGLAAKSLTVIGAAIEFGEFAEIDLITRVTATVGELGHHEPTGSACIPVTVELTQAGAAVASAQMQVAACG